MASPVTSFVQVVIPFADDGQPSRRSSLDWCVSQWVERYGLPVLVHEVELPWRKGAAVAGAMADVPADRRVVIIADGDVFLPAHDARKLDAAIEFAFWHGGWSVPASRVIRLTAEASAQIKRQPIAPPVVQVPDGGVEETHRQHAGGGLVVIHRDAYEACPMDPRFEGWGHEDDAWSYALHTLVGAPLWAAGTLYHLWHQPQERVTRIFGSPHNQALFARYHDARHNRTATRAIIDEWRTA